MQLALTLTGPEPIHAPPAAEPGTYPCPCCGGRVVDEYTEGDALCCWCRDIDDPRLAERVRATLPGGLPEQRLVPVLEGTGGGR